MKRKHEEEVELFSFRNLSIYVDLQREADEYVDRSCLSGIITRGLRGNEGLRGPVAIPFVAIKSPYGPERIESPSFTQLTVKLWRLEPRSHILIGEINSGANGIFPFCHQLFSRLSKSISLGLIIDCVNPTRLGEEILQEAKSNSDYFDAWKEATEIYFRKYDERISDP